MSSTDDAPAMEILLALRTCAYSWEPFARIIGNIRAVDIARACNDAIMALEAGDLEAAGIGTGCEDTMKVLPT